MPSIQILEAFTKQPPPLDFIWPGFLAGSVGALIAPGASSKSYWGMQAAMAVAADHPEADLMEVQPGGHGPVLYLAAEDPAPAIRHRLHAIGRHLPPDAREAIAERLTIDAALGQQLDLMNKKTTEHLIKRSQGHRLIILDTISRLHTADENSNGDMARLIARMEHIAAETEAAVLFLHHVSKAAGRDGLTDQQAGRGASALVDNSRWAAWLQRMSPEQAGKWSTRPDCRQPVGQRHIHYVQWGVAKQNYSQPISPRWYERVEGGVLDPVDLVPVDTRNSGTRRAA